MIVIIGGGITGLAVAREFLKRGYEDIVVLEKEESLGMHASGRNSGVLHAGIYYTPDSLKAKFCIKGNLLMKEYCYEKGIPVRETGKVIVTKNERELPTLMELSKRAKANGSKVKLIDEQELREIEPYAKTVGNALYSPLTAVVDPVTIIKSLEKELTDTGRVKFIKKTEVQGLKGSKILKTNHGEFRFDLLINCAGAYADKIAHLFTLGLEYTIIPIKGTYKKVKSDKNYLVKGNIYPVPDINNPFLGVHLTKSFNGNLYVGPTAIPAFGRENYSFLKGIDRESMFILFNHLKLFLKNSSYRAIARQELKKYFSDYIYKDVSSMVRGLKKQDLIPSDKVGIRPQLLNTNNYKLVMDYVVLQDSNSIHILNAISPAFTSSFAFAEFIVSKFIKESDKCHSNSNH